MESEISKLKEKIKSLLADFLGIDVDDIKDEYLLSDDLHMTPTEIADFLQTLENAGFDTSTLDLSATETVEELMESLT